MEETNNDKNIFLTRGCCKAPNLNNNTDEFYKHGCCKLNTHDWLKDINQPYDKKTFDYIEVRFKNSRKDFFKLTDDLEYFVGDLVAVEGVPGHDIGIVSLVGDLVKMQMKKKNTDVKNTDIKKVFRKARPSDVEKWITAIEKENITMEKAKKIAWDHKLGMKTN